MKEPEEHLFTDSCGKVVDRVTVGRDRFITLPTCDIDTVCHFRMGGKSGTCPVPHSRCEAGELKQQQQQGEKMESGVDEVGLACARGDIGAMVEYMGTGKIRKSILTDSIEPCPSDQEEPDGYVRNEVVLTFVGHNPVRNSTGQGLWYDCEVVPCAESHKLNHRRWHGRGETLLHAVQICLRRYENDEQGDYNPMDMGKPVLPNAGAQAPGGLTMDDTDRCMIHGCEYGGLVDYEGHRMCLVCGKVDYTPDEDDDDFDDGTPNSR